MINEIQKIQSGGSMPPFTYYQPVFVNTGRATSTSDTSSSSSSSSSKKDDKLGDKDMMEMLGKIDGLPSDMNQVFLMMQKFYDMKELGGMSTSSLSQQYLKAMQALKVATFNKSQLDDTKKNIINQQGLNEIAVSEGGYVIVADKDGKPKQVHLTTYLKDKSKYTPYTNSNLLNYRAQYAPYDQTILNIVNNGIGMQQIDRLIHQYMESLGTSTNSSSQVIAKKFSGMANSIDALVKLSDEGKDVTSKGISGIYDIDQLTKTQKEQAAHAIRYIYQMLPDNAKTLLQAKLGSETDATNYVLQVITDKVQSTVSDTNEHKETMLTDLKGKKTGGTGTSGSKEAEPYQDLFQNIVQGEGGTNAKFAMQDKDGNTYTINGMSFPSLTRDPSKPVASTGSLDQLLFDNQFSSIMKGNGEAITFGDQVLDKSDYQNVAFMNDGNAMRVIIPVTVDPKGSGKMVPDLKFMEENKELLDLIQKKKNLEDPEVKKKLVEANIVDPFTGLPDTKRFKPYFIVNGLATSQEIKDNNFVTELKGDKLDKYIDIFKNSVYLDKDHNSGKDKKYDFDTFTTLNPFDWFGMYDKLFKGTIFIPITQNVLQAKIGAGTSVKQSTADNMEETYQAGETRQNMNPTTSNLLGL